jgi:hypothetical protein
MDETNTLPPARLYYINFPKGRYARAANKRKRLNPLAALLVETGTRGNVLAEKIGYTSNSVSAARRGALKTNLDPFLAGLGYHFVQIDTYTFEIKKIETQNTENNERSSNV